MTWIIVTTFVAGAMGTFAGMRFGITIERRRWLDAADTGAPIEADGSLYSARYIREASR